MEKIIEPYKNKLKTKYSKNEENLGVALNFLKVASMSESDFIWFLEMMIYLFQQLSKKLLSLLI